MFTDPQTKWMMMKRHGPPISLAAKGIDLDSPSSVLIPSDRPRWKTKTQAASDPREERASDGTRRAYVGWDVKP